MYLAAGSLAVRYHNSNALYKQYFVIYEQVTLKHDWSVTHGHWRKIRNKKRQRSLLLFRLHTWMSHYSHLAARIDNLKNSFWKNIHFGVVWSGWSSIFLKHPFRFYSSFSSNLNGAKSLAIPSPQKSLLTDSSSMLTGLCPIWVLKADYTSVKSVLQWTSVWNVFILFKFLSFQQIFSLHINIMQVYSAFCFV